MVLFSRRSHWQHYYLKLKILFFHFHISSNVPKKTRKIMYIICYIIYIILYSSSHQTYQNYIAHLKFSSLPQLLMLRNLKMLYYLKGKKSKVNCGHVYKIMLFYRNCLTNLVVVYWKCRVTLSFSQLLNASRQGLSTYWHFKADNSLNRRSLYCAL